MKDRYLFKAKRTDNMEWVQGCCFTQYERFFIKDIQKSFATTIYNEPSVVDFNVRAFEVASNTICQCTGLKDKNGKLIWENDIMVAHLDDDYPEDETYIRIMWHGSGFCSKENGSEDIIPIDKFDREHFEVCGNIFDNQDLLEMEV